jgi:hypothetical protein
LSQQLIEVTETRQKRCPPQGEKVLFVYFLSPLGQKVRRLAVRELPVWLFRIKLMRATDEPSVALTKEKVRLNLVSSRTFSCYLAISISRLDL